MGIEGGKGSGFMSAITIPEAIMKLALENPNRHFKRKRIKSSKAAFHCPNRHSIAAQIGGVWAAQIGGMQGS